MTTFRTELHIEENPEKIEYNSSILSFGSGFSNILTDHFKKYHFKVNSNPFGNIYNPISIYNVVDLALNNPSVNESMITETEGTFGHFDFHWALNAPSKNGLAGKLTETIEQTHNYINSTDFLLLTFGSAYAYRHKETGRIVANCHRAPGRLFEKVLLTPDEIVAGFRKVYKNLNHVKNIILIVSPIMHTGDSITLNAVSKSILRLACHQILSEFPYVKYFPAYEFLLSDLRDYRFYEKDLIHPTEQAMDYIFDKFVEAYVHPETKALISEIEEILHAIDHVPYTPQSNKHLEQIQKATEKIRSLEGKLDLSELKRELEAKSK